MTTHIVKDTVITAKTVYQSSELTVEYLGRFHMLHITILFAVLPILVLVCIIITIPIVAIGGTGAAFFLLFPVCFGAVLAIIGFFLLTSIYLFGGESVLVQLERDPPSLYPKETKFPNTFQLKRWSEVEEHWFIHINLSKPVILIMPSGTELTIPAGSIPKRALPKLSFIPTK